MTTRESKCLYRKLKQGDLQRAALMKHLEPTKLSKHQVSWENVVRLLYEASARTGFEAARINVIG
jgi:hypothetical protein